MNGVTYRLSNKKADNGKSQLFIRLHPNRNMDVSLPTNIYLHSKYFAVTGNASRYETGVIRVPKQGKLNFAEVKEVKEAEQSLKEITNKVLRICEVMPLNEISKEFILDTLSLFSGRNAIDITASSIREAQERRAQEALRINRKGFFDYADAYLQENKFANSRTHSFHVLMRTLHRWQEYRKAIEPNEQFTIELDALTADDVQDFKEYVRNEYALQDEFPKLYARLLTEYPVELTPKHKHARAEQRGENTITKFMKFFKTYWLWLMVQKGATTNNPFIGVKMGTAVYGVPYYLTIEERNRLAEFDLTARPNLAVQRDIFVFQCLVGCRVSDLYKFTEANITDGILEYVPIKTKDNAEQVKPRVPLNERAKSLIKQYKGKDTKGRLFPYISTQKYNDAIKEALKVCGIDRYVAVRNSLTGETEMKPLYEVASSHMARRTFVGTAYSKVQDPNLIGKMSGHVEGSRAFARYRAITDDLLKDVINLID